MHTVTNLYLVHNLKHFPYSSHVMIDHNAHVELDGWAGVGRDMGFTGMCLDTH